MHLRTLKLLLATSFALVVGGIWRISQGQGDNGLGLLVLGLGCSLALLLADRRAPVGPGKTVTAIPTPVLCENLMVIPADGANGQAKEHAASYTLRQRSFNQRERRGLRQKAGLAGDRATQSPEIDLMESLIGMAHSEDTCA